MSDTKTNRYFCVHGHFYQPPRENPLIEQVELQPSALPGHDWNERVFLECYAPNGASRILDSHGRIEDILNNYAYMSFNIGPTLFSWLEEKHPYTYSRILDADRQSCERLGGHGNAIAQVYNHVIMPLATAEQKRLQVKWGIADFERRFHRRPEGMWLAETAINMDSVVAMIREGIKFTVLAPTQAHRVRALAEDTWTDVANNTIDPRRPYRIFPVAEDGTPIEKGYLDVFFYDGPLSHGVGFEHLLKNASHFGDRIGQAFDRNDHGDQLVSVCTDGESYGHHEPFGDMCVAFLFKDIAPRQNMVPVNYAWFLANHPSRHEVRLKNAHGDGTAWSCAHGVGRWKEDCGCSNGGQEGWNQKWRGPLRRAFDILYGYAEKYTEATGPSLFKDWSMAKDTAILAWQLDPSVRKAWWEANLRPEADRSKASDLIEILRYSHYIFTSCAWFFSEITGIETVQNLKYAQRVLQLLESAGITSDLRTAFLAALSKAESNVSAKPGDKVFLDLEHETLPLHAYLALGQWVKDFTEAPFAYAESPAWHLVAEGRRTFGLWTIRESRFVHEVTGASETAWLVFHQDGFDADVFAYCRNPPVPLETWEPDTDPHSDTAQQWLAPLNPTVLGAKSLPLDIKDNMAVHLKNEFWHESEPEVRMQEWRLAVKQKQFQRLGWPLPVSIQQTLHIIENFRLVEALLAGMKKDDIGEMLRALVMATRLRSQGIVAHLGPAKAQLHSYMLLLGRRLIESREKADLKPFFVLLDLVDTLKLNLERYRIENLAFPILKALNSWNESKPLGMNFDPEDAILLLDRLNFNTESAKKYLDSRKAMEP
ncbi:MAG: glycoside hydrolase family 57 [Fibrobacteres bacterium]|nr:glycoside hydrolase family 57 [Fibrobacterota bacterium]